MLRPVMRSRAPYELYRRGRSPFWYVDFIDRDGRRVRRSTKESNQFRAHAVARELERRAADPTYQAANEATLRSAAGALVEHLTNQGRAKRTIEFYEQKLKSVAQALGGDHVSLVKLENPAVIDGLIRQRRLDGAKRYTISKELTALRMLLKVARRRGQFNKEVSQVMPVGFATGYKPRTRRVTVAEAWALIREIAQRSPGVARYTAFVCATTARDAAVARALGADKTRAGILVRDQKTKASGRVVPLTKVTRPFARFAFKDVSDEAQVAPGVSSVRHAFDTACKRLKLAHLSPNDLRRSVAHWHLAAGVPRDVVAAFMGHTSTKMLDMAYGKLDPEEIGAAMKRALG